MTRPLDQFYKEQRFLRAKYLAYFHELKYKNIIKKRTELQITVNLYNKLKKALIF